MPCDPYIARFLGKRSPTYVAHRPSEIAGVRPFDDHYRNTDARDLEPADYSTVFRGAKAVLAAKDVASALFLRNLKNKITDSVRWCGFILAVCCCV
jgi:hypothetical protein